MKTLLIGGTALSGPFIVRELMHRGHDVIVFHRGKSNSPLLPECTHLYGDRKDLPKFEDALRRINADAVVDMCSANAEESLCVIRAFRGRIRTSVHISSGDVYREIGTRKLLSEDSPLREGLPYGGRLGESYDKKRVEAVVMEACAAGDFPAVIIRYPVIYGPGVGSAAYREWPLIKRVLDGRGRVAIPQIAFEIPTVRGFVENLAGGVVDALETKAAIGKTYNLADIDALNLPDMVRRIAAILGRAIEPVAVPTDRFEGSIYSGPLGRYDLSRALADLAYRDRVNVNTALERAVQWQVDHPPHEMALLDPDAYGIEDWLLERFGC